MSTNRPRPRGSGAVAPSDPKGASSGCQIGELLGILGQPHMLRVLRAFKEKEDGTLRFTELQYQLRLSPRTLSHRLKTLVEAGFLSRRAFNETPPRVEYEATVKTSELAQLFEILERWAERNSLHPIPMVSTVGRVSS